MTINRRLYASACLAGPLVDAGLGPQDADALKGLLSGTLDDLVSYARNLPQAPHCSGSGARQNTSKTAPSGKRQSQPAIELGATCR